MIGVDTTFLVDIELEELPRHAAARALLETQRAGLARCWSSHRKSSLS